jgi:signal transduction histidine kinase
MDMRQVLEDVLHHMKVQFENKHAVVQFQQDGEQYVINGDKAHISGVLYNLLDNALKYSPHQPIINVNLSRENGSIKLVIQDQGIGIESDYHDKVFEKLYRAPQQNRHDVKGHGLGLSYVADIIDKHHGKIDLVSEPGKGSTFSMTLPVWHEN